MVYSFSYHEIDTIKLEKQKAMQRYNTFNKITKIVRTFEILVAISLIFYAISYAISLATYYIPTLMEFSCAFLRQFVSVLFCPHFVFLIGNVIIITLFAKSKSTVNSENNLGGDEMFRKITTQYSPIQNPSMNAKSTNITSSKNLGDDEMFRKVSSTTTIQYDPTQVESRDIFIDAEATTPITQYDPTEVESREIFSEAVATTPITQYDPTEMGSQEIFHEALATPPMIQYDPIKVQSRKNFHDTATTTTQYDYNWEFEEKLYRRTKSSSEMVVAKAEEVEKKELRRSKTEVRREKESPAVVNEEDELSNEEFRKKVEAFIEKQQRLLREERLAVIVSNKTM